MNCLRHKNIPSTSQNFVHVKLITFLGDSTVISLMDVCGETEAGFAGVLLGSTVSLCVPERYLFTVSAYPFHLPHPSLLVTLLIPYCRPSGR